MRTPCMLCGAGDATTEQEKELERGEILGVVHLSCVLKASRPDSKPLPNSEPPKGLFQKGQKVVIRYPDSIQLYRGGKMKPSLRLTKLNGRRGVIMGSAGDERWIVKTEDGIDHQILQQYLKEPPTP